MDHWLKETLLARLNSFAQDTGNPQRHRDNLRKLAEGYPADALNLRGTYPLLESSFLWDRVDGFPHGSKKIIREYFGVKTPINPSVARLNVLSDLKLYVLFRVADHPFIPGEFSKEGAAGMSASRSQLHTHKQLLDKVKGHRGRFFLRPEVAEVWPKWKKDNAEKLQAVIDKYAPNGLPNGELPEEDAGVLFQSERELTLLDLSEANRWLYQGINAGEQKMVLGMLEADERGITHSVRQLNLIAGNYMEICVRRRCKAMGVAA